MIILLWWISQLQGVPQNASHILINKTFNNHTTMYHFDISVLWRRFNAWKVSIVYFSRCTRQFEKKLTLYSMHKCPIRQVGYLTETKSRYVMLRWLYGDSKSAPQFNRILLFQDICSYCRCFAWCRMVWT